MTAVTIETTTRFEPHFDENGLIPAIIVSASGGDVLMFAHMNAEALKLSLESGFVHFYSRSRRKLWRKGEESGNTLAIKDIRVDCDQDVLLVSAELSGQRVACHTGAQSCFYRRIVLGQNSLLERIGI